MDTARLRAERLRCHRLSAPAADVRAAAAHMLAVQAQEFWAGRWALAVRTRGAPGLSEVDAAFERGDLVRSWPMRGTLHIVPAVELGWMLRVTGERQLKAAASRHRGLGLDHDTLARAERAVRAALRGGGRLSRTEAFDVLRTIGIDPAQQRGVHVLYALAVRGVIVQGPVVPRSAGPTREQFFVLAEEWLPTAAAPADPLAELFVRYIVGHGPAGAADFAWWSGLPLTTARRAAEAAASRLRRVGEGLWEAPRAPRRSSSAPEVVALGAFEEYVISYVDRTAVCAPERLAAVIPGGNGIIHPVIVARGEVISVWTHSRAMGRHRDEPLPGLLAPNAAEAADIAAALRRYAEFVVA